MGYKELVKTFEQERERDFALEQDESRVWEATEKSVTASQLGRW